MSRLPENPSRNDVLTFISNSASYGNLGAFIGAGFTKAILNDDDKKIALSWGELLEAACGALDIDYDDIEKEGIGYPEVASSICKKHAVDKEQSYNDSLRDLKREIAALTSWYPDEETRQKFSNYLECLSPSWIITTNYDLVIESLLTGKSIPLGPNDSLSSPAGIIPVFHLHGIRTNPDEIIIAQEDYVALFRPSEYRQIKLALTIKESTTLLIGYGIGDVNVLTALDWSKNVFKGKEGSYPNDVIQVLRKKKPQKDPYRDKNGILIIEVSDLSEFFQEFKDARAVLLRAEATEQAELRELAETLNEPDGALIERFIDDPDFRANMLKILGNFSIHLISGFVSFLNKCIDETWVRSRGDGEFDGYNQNLQIIIDILVAFPFEKFPPALFQTAAYALQRVGYYIGPNRGQAWKAYENWEKRKRTLDATIIKELKHIAQQHRYATLHLLVAKL